MTDAGRAAIERAKADGSWSLLEPVEVSYSCRTTSRRPLTDELESELDGMCFLRLPSVSSCSGSRLPSAKPRASSEWPPLLRSWKMAGAWENAESQRVVRTVSTNLRSPVPLHRERVELRIDGQYIRWVLPRRSPHSVTGETSLLHPPPHLGHMKHTDTPRPSVRPSRGLSRLVSLGEPGRRSRGQALVETALVLPVLLLSCCCWRWTSAGCSPPTWRSTTPPARAPSMPLSTPRTRPSFPRRPSTPRRARPRSARSTSRARGRGRLPSLNGPTCHVAGAPASTLSCDAAATSSFRHRQPGTSFEVARPFDLLTPFVGELFGGSLRTEGHRHRPGAQPRQRDHPGPGRCDADAAADGDTHTHIRHQHRTPRRPRRRHRILVPRPRPTPTPTPPPTCEVPDVGTGQSLQRRPRSAGCLGGGEGFTGSLINQSGNKKIKSQLRFPRAPSSRLHLHHVRDAVELGRPWPSRDDPVGAQESGQTLVEFALVLPILLVVIIGVFDGGRAVFTNTTLSQGCTRGRSPGGGGRPPTWGSIDQRLCRVRRLYVGTSGNPGARVCPADP